LNGALGEGEFEEFEVELEMEKVLRLIKLKGDF
jgi:hypothetical protein